MNSKNSVETVTKWLAKKLKGNDKLYDVYKIKLAGIIMDEILGSNILLKVGDGEIPKLQKMVFVHNCAGKFLDLLIKEGEKC
jgi:hypothetical protein